MRSTPTFFRRLVPALLLAGLTLASCQCRKDHDPKPKGQCGTPTTGTTKPGGNS
ncbi:hypothetical protein [Hymenobacter daeguensis]